MSLVRSHINEKFTEDSDPIRDLNIGILNGYFKFDTYEEAQDFFVENCIAVILEKPEIPNDILGQDTYYINTKYYKKLHVWFDAHTEIKTGENFLMPNELGYYLYRKGYKVKCSHSLSDYYSMDNTKGNKHIPQDKK